MAEDHKAAYAAAEAQRKAVRLQRRDNNVRALEVAGVAFAVLNEGWHLRIEHNGDIIDFMPGVGTWKARSHPDGHYGVRELIRYIAKGTLPSVDVERGRRGG